MQYKLKHRLSAALMAGAMCCTMIPAASAEEISTPEIADPSMQQPPAADTLNPSVGRYIYMYIKHGEKKFCGNAFEKAI